MADLTTYEGLKAAVADYLGRDDLAERIPTFIRLAEKRMERDMRLRVMEHRAVRPVDAGTKGVKLPGACGTPLPCPQGFGKGTQMPCGCGTPARSGKDRQKRPRLRSGACSMEYV